MRRELGSLVLYGLHKNGQIGALSSKALKTLTISAIGGFQFGYLLSFQRVLFCYA